MWEKRESGKLWEEIVLCQNNNKPNQSFDQFESKKKFHRVKMKLWQETGKVSEK
jgi:hypothetical protein